MLNLSSTIKTELTSLLAEEITWRECQHTGTSNHLYSGDSDRLSHELILRVNEVTHRIGVNRQRELSLLRHLQGLNGVPKLLGASEYWLLMPRYCEYETLSSQALLEIVAQLQATQSPDDHKQLWRIQYESLWQQYADICPSLPNSKPLLSLLSQVQDGFNRLPELPRVLVHHDLHPGNVMQENGQLVLIDWEYAGVGCAWVDLVALHRYWGVGAAQLQQLPLLTHVSIDDIEEGLLATQHWLLLLEELWAGVYLSRVAY